MSFLYFLPSKSRAEITSDYLQSIGLSYAFDRSPELREVTGEGPARKPGVVAAINAEKLGYYPASQLWIPHPDAEGCWIGRVKDQSITPEMLAREHMLGGKEIRLQDNNVWHAPLIRAYVTPEQLGADQGAWGNVLPRVMGVDPESAAEGKFKLRWDSIDQRYAHLWDIAIEYHKWFFRSIDAEGDEYDEEETEMLTMSAIKVLQTNYRIGLGEATLLNLFDSRTQYAQNILNYSAIDWDTLNEWLKKTSDIASQDGLSTSLGSQENPSQATDQHLLTTLP